VPSNVSLFLIPTVRREFYAPFEPQTLQTSARARIEKRKSIELYVEKKETLADLCFSAADLCIE
jgi:hypothetical protein